MSKEEKKVEAPETNDAPDSATKAERKAHVAKYAKQNPAKYETKKEALAKWIAAA